MDETREGIDKQKVLIRDIIIQFMMLQPINTLKFPQEIDEILAGALTAEDEEAVDLEYEEIIRQNLPDVPAEIDETGIDINQLPSVPTEEPAEKAKLKKIKQEPVQLLA